MKILFLSSWYPYPADNGSKIRIYNILRGLSRHSDGTRHHDVTLLSFSDQQQNETPAELEALCQAVYSVPRRLFNPTSKEAALGLFSMTPRSVIDTYQPVMAQLIRQLLDENSFDLIIASQWWTAAYQSEFGHTPALYEEVELGVFDSKVEQAGSIFERSRHQLTMFKLKFYLRRQLNLFGACTVVSDIERSRLNNLAPEYKNVEVIPNCIDVSDYERYREAPQPNTLIFTGSLTYFANHDAFSWFVDEIYDAIREQIPEIRVSVTGNPGEASYSESEGISLLGLVDDVRPLIASSWISLAPIRLGGGTRIKILEAMALGTPVVTTSIGVEGLDARHEEHVLIADTPDSFAKAILRLLRDSGLRERLAANSLRLVEQRYNWQSVLPSFLDLLENVSQVGDSSDKISA